MFSPAVRLYHLHDPRLRTETFSFNDFFKGPLLSGGPLFSGGPLLLGFNKKGKINVTFVETVTFGILRYFVLKSLFMSLYVYSINF